jgi:hypothetical protein
MATKQNDNQRRVLSRTAARELTPKEIEHVTGGIRTTTVCTFDANTKQPDGDVGEC